MPKSNRYSPEVRECAIRMVAPPPTRPMQAQVARPSRDEIPRSISYLPLSPSPADDRPNSWR